MNYIDYLRNHFLRSLSSFEGDATPLWGTMNAQQMIEHLSDSVFLAYRKPFPREKVNWERAPKAHAWFFEQKNDFVKNTKIIGVPDAPKPVRHDHFLASRAELVEALADMDSTFQSHDNHGFCHPAFGQLTNDEWYEFVARHCDYHFRQFGVETMPK